jgi:hypothetical protein
MILSTDDELIYENFNISGLSKKVLTISSHIRPTFPDVWFFRWCNNNEDKIYNSLKKRLSLEVNIYDQAEEYLDILCEKKTFSWPNVFWEVEDLLEFKNKYLLGINNLVIVEVVLPEKYYIDFMYNEKHENTYEVSVYKLLQNATEISIGPKEKLGFDICGYSNNQFYSYICNGLQKEFLEKGIKLNKYSLIDSYENADEIIELIDKKVLISEEILWYPWLLIKCNE